MIAHTYPIRWHLLRTQAPKSLHFGSQGGEQWLHGAGAVFSLPSASRDDPYVTEYWSFASAKYAR